MKKKTTYILISFIIITTIAYLALARPWQDRTPKDMIEFKDIKPTDPALFPITLRNIDSLKQKTVIQKDIKIAMADGVKLSANVYRPIGSEQYPVVLSFTSYNKDSGPTASPVLNAAYSNDYNLGHYQLSEWGMWEGPDPAYWLSHGYSVVQVDSRGFGKSEGNASLFDQQNIDDFHKVITWAGEQAWSNGNVGLNGVSYLAIAQWVAASKNPPKYLKAIIPWEGQTDSYRDVIYHGGIPETIFTKFWVNRVNGQANGKKPLPPFPVFDIAHKNSKLFQKVAKTPTIYLETIDVPTLVCGTWSDQGLHSRGSFEGYKRIGSQQKWLYTHGRPKWSTYYSDEALNFQKDFFDHFLKGEENGFDSRPSVRLEVRDGLDKYHVRYEDSWPLKNTQYTPLYLNTSTNTLEKNPTSEVGSTHYKPFEGKASYQYIFNEDTELSGYMKLRLWVSTSKGRDMDLFVAVRKLDNTGQEVHFYAKTGYKYGPASIGWLRVSERELDLKRSTEWQPFLTHAHPQKISKNEIVPVDIEILPSSTFFKKGEILQLDIQGEDIFVLPSLGHFYSVNEGEHTIYSGGKYDSFLLVPIIPIEKEGDTK